MLEKINLRIKKAGGGLLHDSRADIRALSKVCNELIDKVNELVDKVNELERKGNDHGM